MPKPACLSTQRLANKRAFLIVVQAYQGRARPLRRPYDKKPSETIRLRRIASRTACMQEKRYHPQYIRGNNKQGIHIDRHWHMPSHGDASHAGWRKEADALVAMFRFHVGSVWVLPATALIGVVYAFIVA